MYMYNIFALLWAPTISLTKTSELTTATLNPPRQPLFMIAIASLAMDHHWDLCIMSLSIDYKTSIK